ncbi:DUF2254 domain-containing protein [Ruegeria marisflavi]|nr:DUF2254 domain-containing protein [Ruegeria sp. WL0004]
MRNKVLNILRRMLRLLYVRIILIAALSLMSVPLAALLGDLIPPGLADRIGAAAVDPILATLATSMLAVTTFSLTVMTGAHRAAWAQWGPRTHVILKDDTATHSILAVFVGAYLFAMSGMVLRRTPIFGEQESVALFAMTLLVIALIVVSIIRWIAHLEDLGSFGETLAQVERRVAVSLRTLAQTPCYGANALTEGADLPAGGQPVRAPRAGYVQQIFTGMLQELAQQAETQVYVAVSVGDYVQEGQDLARFNTGNLDEEVAKAALRAFAVEGARTFVQDPLFGLSVLGDMACRALSPGINDPSTAITVIDRLSSLLLLAGAEPEGDGPTYDRVWLRPLPPEALFAETFDRIARDGAGNIEVQLAVQRALAAILTRGDGELAQAARRSAARSLARGIAGLSAAEDRDRLERVSRGS